MDSHIYHLQTFLECNVRQFQLLSPLLGANAYFSRMYWPRTIMCNTWTELLEFQFEVLLWFLQSVYNKIFRFVFFFVFSADPPLSRKISAKILTRAGSARRFTQLMFLSLALTWRVLRIPSPIGETTTILDCLTWFVCDVSLCCEKACAASPGTFMPSMDSLVKERSRLRPEKTHALQAWEKPFVTIWKKN